MGQIPLCALPWKCVSYYLILTLGLFSNNLFWRGKVLWNASITDFMMLLRSMNFVFNVLLWGLALLSCFDFSDHWALMSNWDLSFFLYILGVWIFLTLPPDHQIFIIQPLGKVYTRWEDDRMTGGRTTANLPHPVSVDPVRTDLSQPWTKLGKITKEQPSSL